MMVRLFAMGMMLAACSVGENSSEVESIRRNQDAVRGTPLDVLLVFRPALGHLSAHQSYADRDRRLTEKMVRWVKGLLPKIAARDYQIAVLGELCVQPIVRKTSQPSPDKALEDALQQAIIERSPQADPNAPKVGLAGGIAAYSLLSSVMTGLTDIFASQLTWESTLPQPGTITDVIGREVRYTRLSSGAVREEYGDDPSAEYRQLANGLIATDSYDQHDKARCNKSWLREGSWLAIVAIDVFPPNYKRFSLCNSSYLCTMPDIEEALRSSGHLRGEGASLQRRYRFYGLTDKSGHLYNNPYSQRSERAPVAEINPLLKKESEDDATYFKTKYDRFEQKVNVKIDWHDFENYRLSGSEQQLVDYLGSVDVEQDYQRIFDEIAAVTAGQITTTP